MVLLLDSMQIKEFIQLLQKLEKEQRTKILNQIQNTNLEKENEQLKELLMEKLPLVISYKVAN